jgi:hypothetical protein
MWWVVSKSRRNPYIEPALVDYSPLIVRSHPINKPHTLILMELQFRGTKFSCHEITPQYTYLYPSLTALTETFQYTPPTPAPLSNCENYRSLFYDPTAFARPTRSIWAEHRLSKFNTPERWKTTSFFPVDTSTTRPPGPLDIPRTCSCSSTILNQYWTLSESHHLLPHCSLSDHKLRSQ